MANPRLKRGGICVQHGQTTVASLTPTTTTTLDKLALFRRSPLASIMTTTPRTPMNLRIGVVQLNPKVGLVQSDVSQLLDSCSACGSVFVDRSGSSQYRSCTRVMQQVSFIRCRHIAGNNDGLLAIDFSPRASTCSAFLKWHSQVRPCNPP